MSNLAAFIQTLSFQDSAWKVTTTTNSTTADLRLIFAKANRIPHLMLYFIASTHCYDCWNC